MNRCSTALVLLTVLACSEDRRPTGPGGPPTPSGDAGTNPTSGACGNGVLNGLEPCDGTLFAMGPECSSVGLRTGALRCTASCTLDTSGCEVRDYCTANNKYGNGECDPCDLLGGMRDPDCDAACGMDGSCADKFDSLTGVWTCRHLSKTDPDCGSCGNSVLDGNELCDGAAFANGKITCGDYGFLGGTLGCKRDCAPDFAGCTFSRCGDGRKEATEQCDTNVDGDATCQSRGYAGGMLTCTSSCTITEAQCVRPGCMNGIIELDRGEECEGTNLNGLSCMSRGFAGGDLACDGTCHYDQTRCVAMGCNNGIREPSEQCEGSDLQGATCMSQGFLSGTLGCSTTSCTYDTSQCVAPGCGNNVIEPATEQCEGSNLNGASCTSMAFAGGTLSCNSMCQLDTSQCVARGCGNGIIESPSEQCEGGNLNNASCTTVGFLGGTLSCNSMCLFDTTQCTRGGCGNGIVEPATEQCDGTQLNGGSCQGQGFSGGTISCTAGCRYDISQCNGTGAVCGNGRLEGNELCDGNTFVQGLNRACSALNMGTGMIGCRSCRLDFTTCQTPDFCAQQSPSYYSDGAGCDACQLLGGHTDPDCTAHCGMDGACVDYFDDITGQFTCVAATGQRDPDCGCGDGFLEPATQGQVVIEQCEGANSNFSMSCSDYGFTAGTVRCSAQCALDFGSCR